MEYDSSELSAVPSRPVYLQLSLTTHFLAACSALDWFTALPHALVTETDPSGDIGSTENDLRSHPGCTWQG